MTLAKTLTAAALFGLSLVHASPVESRQTQWQKSVKYTFEGDSLPEGLRASNEDQASGLNSYRPANVIVRDGALELLVKGGQASTPYIGGQLETTEHNILYGSVRTVATLTENAGVCNGMFFFAANDQETDIEWLSDASSNQNQGNRQLWLTNQDRDHDGQKTYTGVQAPADATSAEHEYRLDWTEGSVKWFIDGEQVWEATTDVPNVPGPWLWNNWSNGDKGWTVGPPAQDAVFKIRSIEMDYNVAA